MKFSTTKVIPSAMMAGVILGATMGYFAPDFMNAIGFLGKLFLSALKLIIIPLILVTVVTGVASLGDLRKAGRTGVQTLGYFLGTSAIAIIIGLALVSIISPGSGLTFAGSETAWSASGNLAESFSGYLATFIPDNIVTAMASGHYLGLIILAIFAGGVLGSTGSRGRTTLTFCREINEVLMKLVGLVMFAAPIGLFALVGSTLAANAGSISALTGSLGLLTLTLIVGLLLHAGLVLPVILAMFADRSPVEFLRNTAPALFTALGTASTSATLPITYDCVVNNAKVDNRAGSLVLPLGMIMNLNGSAMFVAIATMFVAQASGTAMSLLDVLAVGATTLVVSLGMGGIPFAGTLALGTVLVTVGLPLEGISLILTIDWLLDRLRTPVNVWAGAVAAAFIADTYEFKTVRRGVTRDRVSGRSSRFSSRSTGERTRNGSRSEGAGSRRTERRPGGGRSWERRDNRDTRDNRDNRREGRQSESGSNRRGGRTQPSPPDRSSPSPFSIKPVSEHSFGGTTAESAPVTDDRRSRNSESRPGRTRTRDQRGSARDSRDQRQAAEEPKPPVVDESADNRTGGPDRDTVKRDLARISAQLKAVKPAEPDAANRVAANHDTANRDIAEKSVEASASTVTANHETASSVAPNHEMPEPVEALSVDVAPVSVSEVRSEAEPVVTPAESQPVSEPVVQEPTVSPEVVEPQFGGRSRRRRAGLPKGDAPAAEETPVTVTESKDSFPIEDATFGRAKKKRERK